MNEENFGGEGLPNEATGGTPNPLNPTPEVKPATELTTETIAETVNQASKTTIDTASSVSETASEVTSPVSETITETANPVSQPMVSTVEIEAAETAAKVEEEKKKKSKKGLIIGLIVGFIVIIGGVIGTLFALGIFKGSDPVTLAMTKLFEGTKPENVALNGVVTIVPEYKTVLKGVSATFDSKVKTGSMINATKASLSVETNAGDYGIDLEELYATADEIYLKIKGTDNLSDLVNEDSTDLNNLMLMYALQILGQIDGEWIRIPLDELKTTGASLDSSAQCLIDAYNSLSKKGNQISEIYKNNAFVSSTTENISIAKKSNPIYKLIFDGEKLIAFSEEIEKNNVIPTNCLDDKESFSADEITEALNNLPAIYVEIDENHNFTRFYTTTVLESRATLEIDLSISYPSTIDVAEPIEYTELEDVIQNQAQELTPETE